MADGEVLRLFLCSPSEQVWPKDVDAIRKKLSSRGVKPGSFRRAFKNGLSVVRVHHAGAEEMDLAARIQFENMRSRDPHSGGIYAVFEFLAGDARGALGEFGLCVYETPLEKTQEDTYARPSHSDVATSKLPANDVERSILERSLYDYLLNSGRAFSRVVEEVDDGALKKYMPAAITPLLAGQGT